MVLLGKSLSIFKYNYGQSCFYGVIFFQVGVVPGSTWEYLGVLLLFCFFELGELGSTWEYLGEPGSTWEYLGVPGSTTLVSPM